MLTQTYLKKGGLLTKIGLGRKTRQRISKKSLAIWGISNFEYALGE